MPQKSIEIRELLKSKSKTKQIFHCVGDSFDVISREVYSGKEVHFPFDTRNGSQKYRYIESITFDGLSPTVVHGVYKDWKRGFGFTRYLSPLIDFLENFPGIGKIMISLKKNSKFNKTEIIFSKDDIESLYQRIRPFRDQQSEELKVLTKNLCADMFPSNVQKQSARYYAGQITRLIENKSVKAEQLNAADIKTISALITELPLDHIFIKKGNFVATKEKFEIVSIETTLRAYRKLLARKNDSKKLEESWHQFFKKYSWILSQMFASPMVIFGDKAYVGGKGIDNQKGKIADFIYKNSFSRSAAIIEIKTHRTPLLMQRPYRKPDVFSVSKELSGAINQVLDQKDTLQKDYHAVVNSADIESFSPICIVLVGQLSSLEKNHLKSLELFRNNSKDALIVTYDELLKRIETILSIFINKTQKAP